MKKTMKKGLSLVLAMLLLLGALSACNQGTNGPSAENSPSNAANTPESDTQNDSQGSGSVEFEEMELTIAHPHPTNETDDVHYLATRFAHYVEEATGGKVTFSIVGDSVLGSDAELLESMTLNTLDMCIVTSTAIGNNTPAHQILSMPFIFRDIDQVHAFLDSEIMDELNAKVVGDSNAVVLGVGDSGFRQCVNNVRPISSAADFAGLKFRVMESPLYIRMFECLGANPTPMAGSEMFSALQVGTIDGLELPVGSIYSMQIYTAGKYIDMTNHLYTGWYLSINNSKWNSLSPELQKVFQEAADKAVIDQRALVSELEEEQISAIESSGNVVSRDVDTSEMQKLVQPIYDEYRDVIGADVMDKTLEFLNDH